ncbi:MAG: sulfatase-like hydrolase/transferase [Candidatus Krumholzibacteria bacterium]|nr:sulfatase-like hydrolase/transferase [Candidatus Krumholzibacteria bacterium]
MAPATSGLPPATNASSSQWREFATLGVACLAFVLTAFYAAPATVYLFNSSEVTTPLLEVLEVSWVPQVALITCVAIFALIGRRRGRQILAAVLLALAALLYLQGNVLVWDYGKFDGKDIDWSRHGLHGVGEALVWLGVLSAAIVSGRRLWRFVPPAAVAIILLSGFSLASHLFSGRTFTPATASGIDDRFYDFSPKQNTLIVIMDAFASPAFDLMLANDSSWPERLDGFTFYRDALGVYPTTLPSIPAIMSGHTTNNSQPVREFLQENMAGEALPTILQENGFLTHTITETVYGKYFTDVPYASTASFLDAVPQNRRLRDALRIWNVALFRFLPHYLKMRVYSDHRWLLQDGNPVGTESRTPFPYSEDEAFRVPSPNQKATWNLRQQLLDNATADSGKPTFKFVHFFTTHTPYFLGSDCGQSTQQEYDELGHEGAVLEQSACALNQVVELLDRLRELKVLDETLVIIAGDHGSHIDLVTGGDRDPKWEGVPALTKVLPTLLVKPVGASGALRVSNAPVSLIDIPNTVATEMGLEPVFPGQALQDVPADAARVRTYYDYTWEHSFWWEDYLPPMTEYRVNGPVRTRESWGEGRVLPSGAGR